MHEIIIKLIFTEDSLFGTSVVNIAYFCLMSLFKLVVYVTADGHLAHLRCHNLLFVSL